LAGTNAMPILNELPLPPAAELRRKIPLKQVKTISGLSIDKIKRRYPSKILRLSPRRLGMTLGDALRIGEDNVA